jgi:tRNA uridine 5-carboxymethylaminomethyl modification enzyme
MGIGVGDTLFHVERTLPRALRFHQFRLSTSSFGEHPKAFSCGQMCGYFEQSRQIGHRSGSDYVIFPSKAFGPAKKDRCVESERFAKLVEKFGAEPARLDQASRIPGVTPAALSALYVAASRRAAA